MRTKKTLCLVITAILLLCIGATALTGCNTPLTAREAYDELMAALDLSVSGDMYGPAYDPETSATNGYIFYYKESVRTDSMIVNTNVNVHCDQDAAYNLHVDEDLMVDLYQETWSISSVTGGIGTKIGDFGFIVGPYPDADSAEERLFYTERPSDGVSATAPEYSDVTLYDDMTAEDFIASDFFRGYSLSSRLEELRNMPFEAFVFDEEVNGDYGAYRQINLLKLTFGVTDEYIADYAERTGERSMFEGCTYVEIELTFGRVSNIYVYRTENLGGGVFNLPQEMYSLYISYLGPNISFPNAGGYTADPALLDRTDLAFSRATF